MKNICYVISGIDKAFAFEWISELLDKNKYQLFFVLLHSSGGGLEDYLITNNIPFKRIQYKTKKDLLIATYKTYQYLKLNKIEIVHCHLLDAGLAGILAAKMAGINNRIYSRHYSTYHHTYFPKGIWYDKIINRCSSKILAVSEVVKNVLIEREKVNPNKIQILHHGFPLKKFDEIPAEQITKLKAKHGFSNNWPIIGVISRYIEWKGIQYIIPAFENFLAEYPNAHLVLANAKGPYEKEVKTLLETLPKDSFTEIPFENDLFTLFKSFDIFVHTPIDSHSEAFGQVYIESMAAGIPSIFTMSGIALEIVEENVNALVVPPQNSNAILIKMIEIAGNAEMRLSLGIHGKNSVKDPFSINNMIKHLEELYA
ncbi:MAG: glycosyltransferase family 4 protein [Opitutaceae bacterium]|nr:glycosyltransferase family 4 protein [Cytophagales bacterium]